MNNTVLILISLSILLLTLVLGVMSVLLYKIFKRYDRPQDDVASSLKFKEFHPQVQDRIKNLSHTNPRDTSLFCQNHNNEAAEGSCAICDDYFCSTCLKPFKNLQYCKDHFSLIMRFEWQEILTLKTSSSNPEEGVLLYDLKKGFYQSMNKPSYIETHYKINIDQDYIETYLVVFGRFEDVDDLKIKFNEGLNKKGPV